MSPAFSHLKRPGSQEKACIGRPTPPTASKYAQLQVNTTKLFDKPVQPVGDNSTKQQASKTPRTPPKKKDPGPGNRTICLTARDERPTMTRTKASDIRNSGPLSARAKTPEMSRQHCELIDKQERKFRRLLHIQAVKQIQQRQQLHRRQKMSRSGCNYYYSDAHQDAYPSPHAPDSSAGGKNDPQPNQYTGHIPRDRSNFGCFSPVQRAHKESFAGTLHSHHNDESEDENSYAIPPPRHNICQYDMKKHVSEKLKLFETMVKRLASVEREKKRLENEEERGNSTGDISSHQHEEKGTEGEGENGSTLMSAVGHGEADSSEPVPFEPHGFSPQEKTVGIVVATVAGKPTRDLKSVIALTNGKKSEALRNAMLGINPNADGRKARSIIGAKASSMISPTRPRTAPQRGFVQFPYKPSLPITTQPQAAVQYPQRLWLENPSDINNEESNNTRSYTLRKGVGIPSWGRAPSTMCVKVCRSGYGVNNSDVKRCCGSAMKQTTHAMVFT